MGMGLGHKYWVHLIRGEFGTLEHCLEWLEKNKDLINEKQWVELDPIVSVKKGICKEYRIQIVEMAEPIKEARK